MDVLNGYRNNHDSSDDDSEDSDKECNVWKRAATVKKIVEEQNCQTEELSQSQEISQIPAKTSRKKNTIWTEVLQDQLISEDLESCLLKNKPAHYESRGKESYDYTLKYSDPRIEKDADCCMDEEDEKCEPRRNSSSFHYNKIKKNVNLDSTEQTAARKIIKVLNEKKVYLIYRIVKIVGIQKAMDLLKMTEQIEDSGGMMIKNNARRRTPGGVYLQLLKSDEGITHEMKDKIFEGEMSCLELKKYYAEKKKKRRKFAKGNKGRKPKESTESKKMESEDISMDGNMDAQETNDIIPNSENSFLETNPTPLPVLTKKPENSLDLEEGEIED